MSRKCEICGKGSIVGNTISHSHRKARRSWLPNIRKIKVREENGTVCTKAVCTRCLRSNKVTKAL
ncbi:MAG TPA: 50S ribosomal protein L28 [Spirochaetota bacterium]|nr:50S ribosomal protein L28 [Spirochaetota bacterium]HPH01651.1 50S ribosomal protein L28 [Spirochaetota bacterium]